MSKLIFLVTEDWWLCQHFLPMVRAAKAAGLDVVVATRLRNHRERIEGEGCQVIPLEANRSSLALGEAAATIRRITGILRQEKPDIVHCIGLRMVLLGGISARLAGSPGLILAPTGLGHLWIENGLIERALRPTVRLIVAGLLRGSRTRYLFENTEDPREFGLDRQRDGVTIVGGAGVDPDAFHVAPDPPAPPVKIAVVSRMLKPKGIAESVAAVARARALGAGVELHLYGAPDPSNRTSLSEADLRAWSEMPGIYWRGRTEDVARVYREHHIAMLLSHREGLPRTLVEAAASGRAIIATDVVGCREVVRDGIDGILVPLGNIEQTAAAIAQLTQDIDLRQRMGAAARSHFLQRFTEGVVSNTARALYENLLTAVRDEPRESGAKR